MWHLLLPGPEHPIYYIRAHWWQEGDSSFCFEQRWASSLPCLVNHPSLSVQFWKLTYLLLARTLGRTVTLLVSVINSDSVSCIISYLDPCIEHGWWAPHTTWQLAQKAYPAGHTCTHNTQIHWESIATKKQRQSTSIEFKKSPCLIEFSLLLIFLLTRMCTGHFFLLFWSFVCLHYPLNWNHCQEWCWKAS